MISTHAVLLFFATASVLTLWSNPTDQTAGSEAAASDQPEIVSFEDAMTHSADKESLAQLESTLRLGELAGKDETKQKEAIKLLLKHLEPGNNTLVRSAAEISLRKLNGVAIPAVRQALTSNSRAQQSAACHAVKAIGVDAIELLPQLTGMLETGDAFSQRAALYALQGFGDQAFDAIESVAGCLESNDFNVHCMACRVLENYGSDALPAEDDLVQILKQGNPSSRGWAAIVLGAIGPTDKNDVVPMLIASLSEAKAQVEKQRVLLGISYLEREAQRAIPTVQEFLDSRTDRVKPHAAFALYKISGDQKTLVSEFLKALDDQNERTFAFDLLKRLEPQEAIPMLPGLVDLLDAAEEDVRENAVLAIGRLGPAAKDALPEVEKLLDDSDVLVQEAAAQTIASLTYDPATENADQIANEKNADEQRK